MIEARFPNLFQFLAGYFNQDWDLFAPEPHEVTAVFIEQASLNVLAATLEELDRLLATGLSEQELEKACDQLGCALAPSGMGLGYAQWLSQVREQLAQGLKEKRSGPPNCEGTNIHDNG